MQTRAAQTLVGLVVFFLTSDFSPLTSGSSPLASDLSPLTSDFSVDDLVHRAVVAGFLENPSEIEKLSDELNAYDKRLRGQGREPTGCGDNLAWLWAESLANAEARMAGERHILGREADPLTKISVRSCLAQRLPEQIRATRRQDRWSRWADLTSAVGQQLGRIANGQLGGAGKLVVELIYAPAHFSKVTERERKEWWLIDTYLRENPKATGAEKLRERMAGLEVRFQKDAVSRCVEMAQSYAERGWWDEALYYVRAAEDKGYTGKKRFRRKVRQTVADRERWTAESVAVADTERFIRTQEQLVAYEALVKALAGGNREQLRQAGLLARRRLEATPLADDVADAWSVLYEWLGDRRTALAEQRNLAASYSEAQAGQAALTRLSDPQYNPQARYKQEMARYHDRQMRYVLTGDRTARQNIELISELATPNVPQLGAAAAFFATDVLIRGLTTAFGNPVSPEDVVAAGEHLLADPRNGLTPEEETRLRLALGAIYGKLRRYDEAAATYRTARISSPELDKRLTELAADEQLRRALDSEEMNDRALLLGEVVESYPKTKAAERARDILKRLETETKVDFAIPYDWLADDPVHWMRLGARIPYNLMDGAKGNGEINQRGLVFWRDRPDVATYVCEDGKTSQVAVTAYRRAALRAAAVAWIDRKAALEEGELTLASRRLPFEVRGSAGPQGLIVFPTPRGAPLSEEDKRLFR